MARQDIAGHSPNVHVSTCICDMYMCMYTCRKHAHHMHSTCIKVFNRKLWPLCVHMHVVLSVARYVIRKCRLNTSVMSLVRFFCGFCFFEYPHYWEPSMLYITVLLMANILSDFIKDTTIILLL